MHLRHLSPRLLEVAGEVGGDGDEGLAARPVPQCHDQTDLRASAKLCGAWLVVPA